MFILTRRFELSLCGVVFLICISFTASTMAWVEPPRDYPDVQIAEQFATGAAVAFDPSRPNRLVAGLAFGDACWVRRSIDGGRTWGKTLPIPRLPGTSCSVSITVSYAWEGSRLHAAYAYHDEDGHWGIAVTASDDHGATWSNPTVKSLPEVTNGCRSLDSAAEPDDSRSVYLAAICNSLGVDQLYFARVDGDDLSWDLFSTIASLDGSTVPQANLAAGRGGAVLVTYGQRALNETAVVVVARSSDRGVSFVLGNATAPFSWESYSTLIPDIAIGSSGTAHLVYMRSIGSSRAVLYKNSVPPYKTWSARARRLDDRDGEQLVTNSPRITASTCENTSILHVSWVESPFPPHPLQSLHKILYTRKLEQGYSWSSPLTVSETTEITTPNLGDIAAGRGKAFPIFEIFSFASFKTRTVGSRVWSGITCR